MAPFLPPQSPTTAGAGQCNGFRESTDGTSEGKNNVVLLAMDHLWSYGVGPGRAADLHLLVRIPFPSANVPWRHLGRRIRLFDSARWPDYLVDTRRHHRREQHPPPSSPHASRMTGRAIYCVCACAFVVTLFSQNQCVPHTHTQIL